MEEDDSKYLRREQPEGVCVCASYVLESVKFRGGTAGWRPEDIIKFRIYANNFLNEAKEHKSQL